MATRKRRANLSKSPNAKKVRGVDVAVEDIFSPVSSVKLTGRTRQLRKSASQIAKVRLNALFICLKFKASIVVGLIARCRVLLTSTHVASNFDRSKFARVDYVIRSNCFELAGIIKE